MICIVSDNPYPNLSNIDSRQEIVILMVAVASPKNCLANGRYQITLWFMISKHNVRVSQVQGPEF